MINLRKYIPEGTRDILFNECTNKKNIEDILRSVYIEMGYREVNSPIFEFYDVYNLKNQPIKQEKMYKLFDNMGRMMVLRPDMTTPIARIAATKIKNKKYPMKLCYTGNVYRMNEVLNGKISEVTQSGIEVIGSNNLRADVEVLIAAIKALIKAGLKGFKIEIGQAEFFKSIVEDIDIEEEYIEQLRTLIENKNFSEVENFIFDNKEKLKDKGNILSKLPELFGGKEVIEKAKKLINNEKALDTLKIISKVYEVVENAGYGEYLSIDLGMVQHINYYTGLIYRGYAKGIGDTLLSGGRYDNLINQFGCDIPATGLAINVDNLMEALENSNKNCADDFVKFMVFGVKIEKAYLEADELNKKGIKAEVSLFDTLHETIEYCMKNKISKVKNIDNGETIDVRSINNEK
ncbi:ATP phosphoribosyltransferase regulatory subunit [Clostridium guangxiense]|uniref:ATP phosphoribosyltransferase regulatory subunit n=1 Tax=Clostridium guangxiense TaxID=1662055 RepID=UPI001E602370|nr:ATP phosphoribosyltransferase regulatory subunit [Clostridium guangxiense]MCD2347325.1 ATP phosphoribosyltransferase regulatory subunit [Clostridium guangxiense]